MPEYRVKAGHFRQAGKVGPPPDYIYEHGAQYGPGDTVTLTEQEVHALGRHRFERVDGGSDRYNGLGTPDPPKPNPTDTEWERAKFGDGMAMAPGIDAAPTPVIAGSGPVAAPVLLAPLVAPVVEAPPSWYAIAAMPAPDACTVVDNVPDAMSLNAIEDAEKSRERPRVTVLDRVKTKRAQMGWS